MRRQRGSVNRRADRDRERRSRLREDIIEFAVHETKRVHLRGRCRLHRLQQRRVRHLPAVEESREERRRDR